MRAIVHSLHSQVPNTIQSLPRRPGLIVSMDSHLDVSLGGDDLLYPKSLREVARRTGAHAAFRRLGSGHGLWDGSLGRSGPRLIVAISEPMFAAHVEDVESQLPPSLRIDDVADSLASCADYLRDAMGIEVFLSPPKSLEKLARITRGVGEWVLDLDVDYIGELQGECYTRIIHREPGVLQSLSAVVDFVEKTRPTTIVLSEVKVSAIRRPKSAFSSLVADLRNQGYLVEMRGIYESDEKVTRGLSVCTEYYRRVSRVLAKEAAVRGKLEGFRDAERAAAKRFFAERGYSP